MTRNPFTGVTRLRTTDRALLALQSRAARLAGCLATLDLEETVVEVLTLPGTDASPYRIVFLRCRLQEIP